MSSNQQQISPTFIVILLLCIFGLEGYLFARESRAVHTYESAVAQVLEVKVAPRTRTALLEFDVGQDTYQATASLWQFTRVAPGRTLNILYDPTEPSEITLDSFGYLHRLSLGIAGGVCALLSLVYLALRKADRSR